MTLIHIGQICGKKGKEPVFLRRIEPKKYGWFTEKNDKEVPTGFEAENIEEALRLAAKKWAFEGFLPIPCGFRFTLPERDEHGNNALFHQMSRSLNSANGIYFEEESGHNCIVHQIPLQTRKLYEKLKSENRL